MRAAGSSVSQRRDRRSVGIECKGRDKVFQRRLLTTNTDVEHTYAELNVTYYLRKLGRMMCAVQRPNMSTVYQYCYTTGDRFPQQRLSSRGCELHIKHILHILYIAAKIKSQTGPYRCGKSRFEITFVYLLLYILHIYITCFLGGSYSAYFICLV